MTILRKPLAAGTVAATVLALGLPVAAVAADPSEAQQLYVARWGNDSWPGTAGRPFATLERAQRAVRAKTAHMESDLVVSVRGGIYPLAAPLRMSDEAGDSGGNGHRVIYQAYGYGTARQEPVTISGGRTVTGWRPDTRRDGLWRADVGGLETRQLYVDGKRADRPTAGVPRTLTLTNTGYTTTSTVPQKWQSPGDIEFVYRYAYLEGRCGVAGISGTATRTTITMDQPCWELAKALYGPEQLPTVHEAENSSSFVTRPGDWYLDRSRPGRHELLYRPRPDEDMRHATVVAPVLEALVTGTGVRDLGFRGLTFAYATWLAPNDPAGFAAAWSMYMRPEGLLTVPGAVAFHNAERVTFEGNRFTHLGGPATAWPR